MLLGCGECTNYTPNTRIILEMKSSNQNYKKKVLKICVIPCVILWIIGTKSMLSKIYKNSGKQNLYSSFSNTIPYLGSF